jgi:hypothetical protein
MCQSMWRMSAVRSMISTCVMHSLECRNATLRLLARTEYSVDTPLIMSPSIKCSYWVAVQSLM